MRTVPTHHLIDEPDRIERNPDPLSTSAKATRNEWPVSLNREMPIGSTRSTQDSSSLSIPRAVTKDATVEAVAHHITPRIPKPVV